MGEFDDTWKDVHVHKKRAEVKDLSFEVSAVYVKWMITESERELSLIYNNKRTFKHECLKTII